MSELFLFTCVDCGCRKMVASEKDEVCYECNPHPDESEPETQDVDSDGEMAEIIESNEMYEQAQVLAADEESMSDVSHELD